MYQLRVIALFVIGSVAAFGVLHLAGNFFGVLGVVIAAVIMYLLIMTVGERVRAAAIRKNDKDEVS